MRPRVENRQSSIARFQKWNVVASVRCRAMRTFSSTVRCGNTADIWNERTMPRRATSAGFRERDVLAVVDDLAAGRDQELGEQVEEGGLAGAVGADQRVDLTAAHPQVDVAHRDEAVELLRQATRLDDEIVRGPAARRWRQSSLRHGVAQSIGSGDTGSSNIAAAPSWQSRYG